MTGLKVERAQIEIARGEEDWLQPLNLGREVAAAASL